MHHGSTTVSSKANIIFNHVNSKLLLESCRGSRNCNCSIACVHSAYCHWVSIDEGTTFGLKFFFQVPITSWLNSDFKQIHWWYIRTIECECCTNKSNCSQPLHLIKKNTNKFNMIWSVTSKNDITAEDEHLSW